MATQEDARRTIAVTPPGLGRVIAANGRFSFVSGVALTAGAPWLGRWFGLPTWVVAMVGIGLAPYGLMLLRWASAAPFDRRVAYVASAGDVTWVVAAVTLIAVPNSMSGSGKVTLGVLTLAVGSFALLQIRALQRNRGE